MPSFCRKTSMSIKFLVLGGGEFGLGGGGVPILFLWARGFFWFNSQNSPCSLFLDREKSLAALLGNPKQHIKLQQPRNYDFWMFQFNLLGTQGGTSREMTTSPPGHYWEGTVALTTAAKLQQVRANSREMTWQVKNSTRSMIRKILVSVKFLSAILGPEMAAPILWAPRISVFFLQENLHVHKIPRFRGGVFWVWGGGECPFYFYGRGDFSDMRFCGGGGEVPILFLWARGFFWHEILQRFMAVVVSSAFRNFLTLV